MAAIIRHRCDNLAQSELREQDIAMKSILTPIVTAVALLLASMATGKSLVREFSGSAAATTAEFSVQGPWLLDWRLDGDYEQLIALDIALIDSRSGRHLGRVLHTKFRGNGVKLFNEGGVYRLRVSSTLAKWRIKIEQITEEEAELYTLRREN